MPAYLYSGRRTGRRAYNSIFIIQFTLNIHTEKPLIPNEKFRIDFTIYVPITKAK